MKKLDLWKIYKYLCGQSNFIRKFRIRKIYYNVDKVNFLYLYVIRIILFDFLYVNNVLYTIDKRSIKI